MIKTKAEFLRDAKSGRMSLRMVRLFGQTKVEIMAEHGDDPFYTKRIQSGVFDNFRKVVKTQTNGIYLEPNSWLEMPSAALFEYDGKFVRIFNPAWTPMTDYEKLVMAEWDKIDSLPENVRQHEIDAMTDGSQMFYKKKRFFKEHHAEQLLGYDFVGSRKLNHNMQNDGNPNCVLDTQVKGTLQFEYEVRLAD